MSKFNQTTKQSTKTVNHEGAEAYKLSPELELYSLAVTTMLSNKFYETERDVMARLKGLIKKVNPEFVVKLAIYARKDMYLRSLPLVLLVELAKIHSGDNLLSRGITKVVARADEITELMAYYQSANKRGDTKKLNKLSKQIQKGLADAFNAFDEYQFAKYNRPGEVKLRDVLMLVHPKAKDEKQQKLFDKIIAGELETPYTWETQLSELGQKKYETEEDKQEAFKNKWQELIDSGKLGYMALLRNLRNIIEAGVDIAHLTEVCKRLGDPEQVARSKQFPFRFLSAYREIKPLVSGQATMVLDALEDAMVASAQNIKGFDYDTSVIVACDVSGSMQHQISQRSKVELYDIGLTLGMLLQNRCKNVVSGMFGSSWKVINVPKNNVLSNVMEFHRREGEVGYATNGYLVVRDLLNRKVVADKVMIFTDCQLWDSYGGGQTLRNAWNQYKKIAPNAKLYLFDLGGYGTTPVDIKSQDVYLIAGWSDKVFDMLDAYEKGGDAIKKINAIEL